MRYSTFFALAAVNVLACVVAIAAEPKGGLPSGTGTPPASVAPAADPGPQTRPAQDGPAAVPVAPAPQRQADPARRRTAPELLRMPVGALQFDETPLREALAELARRADVDMIVRWPALEASGVWPDRAITLKLRGPTLEQALDALIQQAADPHQPLAYRASTELILVTSTAEISRQMVIKSYDVLDLVMIIPEVDFPDMSRRSGGMPFHAHPRRPSYRRPREPGWREVGTPGPYGVGRVLSPNEGAQNENIESLIDVIQKTVDPESWDVNGGPGSITYYYDRLVIRASPLVHQKIGGLLRGR